MNYRRSIVWIVAAVTRTAAGAIVFSCLVISLPIFCIAHLVGGVLRFWESDYSNPVRVGLPLIGMVLLMHHGGMGYFPAVFIAILVFVCVTFGGLAIGRWAVKRAEKAEKEIRGASAAT